MRLEKMTAELKSYFEDVPDIIVAYVFGSFVVGKRHPESDLDIAVLFKNNPDLQEQIKHQNALAKISGCEVDLAVMNAASPILIRQVLEKGQEIYCRDEVAKQLFIIKMLNEYDDLKYFRRSIEENILRGKIYA